jgi:uncharacterized membrane protein YjfL (UPF0719 family)
LKEIGGISNQSVEQITKIIKQVIHAKVTHIVCIIRKFLWPKCTPPKYDKLIQKNKERMLCD